MGMKRASLGALIYVETTTLTFSTCYNSNRCAYAFPMRRSTDETSSDVLQPRELSSERSRFALNVDTEAMETRRHVTIES